MIGLTVGDLIEMLGAYNSNLVVHVKTLDGKLLPVTSFRCSSSKIPVISFEEVNKMDAKYKLRDDMVFLDDRQRFDRGDYTFDDIKLFRCHVDDHPNYYSRIDDHLLSVKGISQDCPVCRWLKHQEQK